MITKLPLILAILCANLSASLSLQEYAEMVGNVDPVIHRIRTLNRTGCAMCYSTELTEAFLDNCKSPNCTRVLEVGCAYGIKSSQIVQTGVFLVANDIDPGHLSIMKNTFDALAETDSHFKNIEYLLGDISALGQEEIGIEKYDAILCESVLHFMHPHEVRAALKAMYESLKPGGKIYFTVMSRYLKKYNEAFESNKEQGLDWPGYFAEDRGIYGPYNVFDEEVLTRELTLAGFNVLKTKYISKPFLEEEYQNDGRDWVIAIAKKE